jgi:hypothetical protein
MNIGDVMSPWAQEAGYPVVTIKQLDMNKIEITQNRYLLYEDNMIEASNSTWYIPFTYARHRYTKIGSNSIQYSIDELYKRIIWLTPNEESSEPFICFRQKLEIF